MGLVTRIDDYCIFVSMENLLVIVTDNSNIDKEIVHNAYSKINIGYAEGDDANSVTSNVDLCTEIEGATVIWSSDKPDVISETVIVTRSDETNIVRLTAVIKSNDFSMDIDFEVRVVKNIYEGYNTDYIYDMDSLELLYIMMIRIIWKYI